MEYDYVIAIGAGSAGSIMASELSEDPEVQVLLLKACGSGKTLILSLPEILHFPCESKKYGWIYQSGPEPHQQGRMVDAKRIG